MQKPLSPHLQIYSPQLTSVLSILHRFSGVGFVLAIILTCLWLYKLTQGESAYLNFCDWMEQGFVKFIFYLILASVYYHILNGLRYLMWSLGEGFELKTVYKSGWSVVALTIILLIITVFFI